MVVDVYAETIVRVSVTTEAGAVSTLVTVVTGRVVVLTTVCGGPALIVEVR